MNTKQAWNECVKAGIPKRDEGVVKKTLDGELEGDIATVKDDRQGRKVVIKATNGWTYIIRK